RPWTSEELQQEDLGSARLDPFTDLFSQRPDLESSLHLLGRLDRQLTDPLATQTMACCRVFERCVTEQSGDSSKRICLYLRRGRQVFFDGSAQIADLHHVLERDPLMGDDVEQCDLFA